MLVNDCAILLPSAAAQRGPFTMRPRLQLRRLNAGEFWHSRRREQADDLVTRQHALLTGCGSHACCVCDQSPWHTTTKIGSPSLVSSTWRPQSHLLQP